MVKKIYIFLFMLIMTGIFVVLTINVSAYTIVDSETTDTGNQYVDCGHKYYSSHLDLTHSFDYYTDTIAVQLWDGGGTAVALYSMGKSRKNK